MDTETQAAIKRCEEALALGAEALLEALAPHGFQLELGTAGVSSGRAFATCYLSHQHLRVAMIARHTGVLGAIIYEVGAAMAIHEDVIKELGLGEPQLLYSDERSSSYARDGSDNFAALANDLESQLVPVLSEDPEAVQQAVQTIHNRRLSSWGLDPSQFSEA